MQSGSGLAIVDTGPLFASIDSDDVDHWRSLMTLKRHDLRLIIPAMVVAETCYLVGEYLGLG